MNSKGISLRSLEANLRSFSNIDVPQGLEARIMATIPCGVEKLRSGLRFGWFKFWTVGLGTSAAALFVIGMMMILKTSTLSNTQAFVEDPIDMPRYFAMYRQADACAVIGQTYNEPNVIN